jgi:urease accessory protein
MKKSSSLSAILFSALTFLPTLVHAHPGHPGHDDDFLSGLAHPFAGLDHVLAMIAVGIWAAQLGGRARWALPAAFVTVMMLGGALGMARVTIPMVDSAILCSVVMLGLLIVTAARPPLGVSLGLVGLFASVHGLAHGAEIPANASGFAFTGGFALATAALHSTGLILAALLGFSARVPVSARAASRR